MASLLHAIMSCDLILVTTINEVKYKATAVCETTYGVNRVANDTSIIFLHIVLQLYGWCGAVPVV